MFKLATIGDYWNITSEPDMMELRRNDRCLLKNIGYAFLIDKIKKSNVNKLLEFGHGDTSRIFERFANRFECWGLDDKRVEYVSQKKLDEFREKHTNCSNAKFISGYLGEDNLSLPENYFDFICSVSVIEHIPRDSIQTVISKVYSLLKPGGLFISSYDVFCHQNIDVVFYSIIRAGFEWVDSNTTKEIDWDPKNVCFEDLRRALFGYMAYIPEEQRAAKWPGNFATILIAAKKA